MNKILLAVLLFFFCAGVYAQDSLYVVKKNGVIIGYKISEVQEINFERISSGENPTDLMSSDAKTLASKMYLGINIGNTLEVVADWCDQEFKETCWGSPKITQQIVDAYKNAGFNTIRIPVSWDIYITNRDNYTINAAWMARVKEVVDYAINRDLYVIINIHWDGGWLEKNCTTEKQSEVNKEQAALWQQIANYYKDYDEHLLFASANEPEVTDATQAEVLKSYHQTFVNTVRASGGNNAKRNLIIQGPLTDAEKSLEFDVMPTDVVANRLMLEFHYYPYTYCLMTEDADWSPVHYFWGKDYQNIYIDDKNRSCTWHTESTIDKNFSDLKAKFVDNGIPIILGEFAVTDRSIGETYQQTFENSRSYYYEYLVKTAKNNGIVPILWDIQGSGIIDRSNCNVIKQEALEGLLRGAETGVYPF